MNKFSESESEPPKANPRAGRKAGKAGRQAGKAGKGGPKPPAPPRPDDEREDDEREDDDLGERELGRLDTQNRVLEAARNQFEKRGFDGTSLRAIADDAGVSAGTVVLHFGDKRSLLHAALFVDLERAFGVALALHTSGSLEKRVVKLFGVFFSYYMSRPKLGRELLRESLFAEGHARNSFITQATRVHREVVTFFREAREKGEVAAGANADVFAAGVIANYYFALLAWAQATHAEPLELFTSLVSQQIAGVVERKKR